MSLLPLRAVSKKIEASSFPGHIQVNWSPSPCSFLSFSHYVQNFYFLGNVYFLSQVFEKLWWRTDSFNYSYAAWIYNGLNKSLFCKGRVRVWEQFKARTDRYPVLEIRPSTRPTGEKHPSRLVQKVGWILEDFYSSFLY